MLLVDNSPAITGAYKSISSITAALKGEIEFTFCLPKGSAAIEDSKALRKTVTLPFLEIRRHLGVIWYVPILILNSLRLLALIRKSGIDVLHVNDLYNMAGVVIKKIFPRLKVVYHVRLLPSSYSGKLYRIWAALILKYADCVICVSQSVQNNFSASPKVTTISDAIDPAPGPSSRPVRRGDETVDILYLANYAPGKGHDDAIRAFAGALRQNSSLRLLMAGGDLGLKKNQKYLKSLMSLAARENVADKIRFMGFVRDTGSLFGNADIFLNFSRSESFSLTCLEALAHGVPVISTDSGGPAELFESGVSGILVPVGDVKAMTDAIVRVSSDRALRQQLGTRGRLHAQQKFSLRASAEQLRKVYFNVLQE